MNIYMYMYIILHTPLCDVNKSQYADQISGSDNNKSDDNGLYCFQPFLNQQLPVSLLLQNQV